jgi:hypothetical protein
MDRLASISTRMVAEARIIYYISNWQSVVVSRSLTSPDYRPIDLAKPFWEVMILVFEIRDRPPPTSGKTQQ